LLLVLFVFICFSCRISTETLAKEVQASLVDYYKENNSEIIFTRDLILTHITGNEYTGGADVTLDGVQMRISLEVISDGKSFQAEWRLVNR
jgi:hypothetical protein